MSDSGSPVVSRRNSDVSGAIVPQPRKFQNGWTKAQEELMAEWADKAGCYRWLHDRCEKKYSMFNMWITIPVIILSTLTGTANFAIDGFVPDGDESIKKYIQAGIGGVSIFAGILTTLGNFLRFAQGSESHRVAGIAWGKFQRQIAVELAISPNDRIDCMDFLKICRAELDRLIEQSPPVPDDIIREFEREFKNQNDIKKPDICHGLEHTKTFKDPSSRLRQLTAEAALTLFHKKRLLRHEILPDIEKIVTRIVDTKLEASEIAEQTGRSSSPSAAMSKSSGKPIDLVKDWKRIANKDTIDGLDFTVKNPIFGAGATEVEKTNTSSDIHIEIVGSETSPHLLNEKNEDQ
jgi:hypothetical protein